MENWYLFRFVTVDRVLIKSLQAEDDNYTFFNAQKRMDIAVRSAILEVANSGYCIYRAAPERRGKYPPLVYN